MIKKQHKDVERITDPFIEEILTKYDIERPHLVLYAARHARDAGISPSLAIEHIRQGLVSIDDLKEDVNENVRRHLKRRKESKEQQVELVETSPIVEPMPDE